jgi:hypothetical protein
VGGCCAMKEKRENVTGGWKQLHNEELQDLYCSPKFFRVGSACRQFSGHVVFMLKQGMNKIFLTCSKIS